MFPKIPGVSALQSSVWANQSSGASKGNSSKTAKDFYSKLSSPYAYQRAVWILYDINNFINSTQSTLKDVQALRRAIRERNFSPSAIGKKFVPQQPCTPYAEQQTAEILADFDSFRGSEYTTLGDGVALRRLINDKFRNNELSKSGTTTYHIAHSEALNYQKLVENYDKAVDGLFAHQIKILTNHLAHKLTISSAELESIQRKRNKSAKVRSLLDTLTTPSKRRKSPEKTALSFKSALERVHSELARDMFHC
ncbi:hypothetical protein [Endozoicomonas sp. GU-1]|uniref:hypothetical protein n=1 Tax=Endozoicomonas sp. GU-1 TaxID=3009078 RepID=UPI0022B2B89E|nr:hypothetical protein [Endozoicomonas sp. GU-1]WBA79475.1 hypothetical protein O2T12_13900 [Endozoicomonas sp. GU-1]WBA87118.1 hypothetical protein O3276_03480 [Endozoicomonas sp. GU-1]